MTAKSKIIRDFSQARSDAVLLQIGLDEIQDPLLIGGEGVAHTYKCTYFGMRKQEANARPGWPFRERSKVKGRRSKVKSQGMKIAVAVRG